MNLRIHPNICDKQLLLHMMYLKSKSYELKEFLESNYLLLILRHYLEPTKIPSYFDKQVRFFFGLMASRIE